MDARAHFECVLARGSMDVLLVLRYLTDGMAVPCSYSKDDLTVTKVLDLLLNSVEGTLSFHPPAKPLSGECYLFSAAGNVKAKGKCSVMTAWISGNWDFYCENR